MNKSQLEHLVQIRISEGKTLLDNGLYQGAYYISGYAIECALKACIAKSVGQHDFPDKSLANKCYTHDLSDLLGVAGLKINLKKREDEDSNFKLNWAVVKDWSEQARYEASVEKTKAVDLYKSITDEHSGILTWLKTHW